MAGALGLEQALGDRDGLGRGHADRLVEDHPAMNVALVAPDLALLTLLAALMAGIVIAAMALMLTLVIAAAVTLLTVVAVLHGRREGGLAIARFIEA
jgi:hypothetical protein